MTSGLDEDKVKEIAAKICHEKMKNLYEHVKSEVKREIVFGILSGEFKIEHFFGSEEFKNFRERMRSECDMHLSGVLREAYTKFMGSFKR